MPRPPLRADRPIALVGMPGAGKTRAGRLLAERLRVPFADSDEAVEREARMSVAELFARFGEAEFRKRERRVLAQFIRGHGVIATGGGAFADEASRSLLLLCSITVWLDAEPDLLAVRVGSGSERPLLGTGNPAMRLRQLADARRCAYARAQVRVDASGTAEETVEAILGALAERTT